ncbi:MAG TPA: hypothetical protein VFD59_09045 [Nocardioidaceae bacterium]|nr:hypothetical protein [Nocardioidaceae bacterium]
MDSEKNEPIETEVEDSNPNAAGPQGLRGGMGVSSERTGQQDETEGTKSTSGEAETLPQQEPAHGPEMDDTQQEATQGWRDEQEAANTAEVPSHDFDPSRNPGHSHG